MIGKIVLRPGVHIGEPAAEDDSKFLQHCFVDMPVVTQLRDIESSKCILLGRTGSGKTAILNHIESRSDHSIRVDPKDIAFDYIGNSNIVTFLIEVGCDLSILFQILWKHVLCTKAIKCYFDNRGIFSKAIDRILDSKNPARIYFEKYQYMFWMEQDEALKEISNGFEEKISSDLRATLGSEFAKVESGLAGGLTLSGAQRREIVARTKKAVSELQIRELSRAIDALNDLMENKQKQYYILIDDLDLDWAENSIKYGLIKALIETVKSFRKLRNVKVIVALRSDLYERALLEDFSGSMQPEKYEGVTCEIKWSSQQLKEIVNSRISYLFKSMYTKQ